MTVTAFAAVLGAVALAGPAAGQHAQRGTATTVTVVLSDSTMTAAPSKVPTGIVVFRVVNLGRAARTFAIGGRRTPAIAPGRSGTLSVDLIGRGPHLFASAGPKGRARLTGVLTVFEPCTRPVATTVTVKMDHDRSGITFSQTTVPCGTVTFVVTNIGALDDSFQVFADYPQAQGATPVLRPHQTARLTIRFTEKGPAFYQSGVFPPNEDEYGGGPDDGGTLKIV